MNLDSLNDKLTSHFGSRLRARQSAFEDRFLIEEHTARGTATTIADLKSFNRVQVKQRHDARVRARDGYSQVMEVRHGMAFGCAACGARLATPVNVTGEVRCVCTHQNYATFFLDEEALITHLRMIDPLNSSLRDRVKSEDERERFEKRHQDRMIHNEGGAHFKDALLEQLPSFGYSGKTQAWVDAPASPKG